MTDEDEVLYEAKKRFPNSNIKITPEQPQFESVLGVILFDILLLTMMTYLAVTVTPWALLGLVFLASANTRYHIEIMQERDHETDGTCRC